MAAVTSTSSQLPYSRRVSFNNLRPHELDAEVPPDVTKFQSYASTPKLNYPRSNDPELSKLFSNYSLSSPIKSSHRKRLKLPEPPARLILKNALSLEEIKLNEIHAHDTYASFNKELNDIVNHPPDSVPRLELAKIVPAQNPESTNNECCAPGEISPHTRLPRGRRKLYSSMTDEELMALDPQFSRRNISDLNDFKFDSLGASYSTQRRNSTPGSYLPSPGKAKQVLYPSLNENNYKSVSLTVKHQDFNRHELHPRIILTVLSGRKHTWNTLDWLLLTDHLVRDQPCFLQNGDHLVVAALVPLKFVETENKNSSRKKDIGEQKVQQKCEDILKYILDNVPDPEIRLKITVELVTDVPFPDPVTISMAPAKKLQTGSKFMMAHLFKQYQPTLVVIGNKSTSLNFKYPRRMSRSTNAGSTTRTSISASSIAAKAPETEAELYLIKLSSYLIRYSTVPVILVGNSTTYHRKPAPKVPPSVTFKDGAIRLKSILDVSPSAPRQNSYCSDISIESFCGTPLNGDDSDSPGPSKPLGNSSLQKVLSDPFAALILDISDKSLMELRTYLEQVKTDKIPSHFFDNKVHQAYVSMEQGRQGLLSKTNSSGASGRAYKVKSLISYDEDEEKKHERMINDKKLNKSISRSSAGSSILRALDEKSNKKKKRRSLLQIFGLKKA
ncbi:hypothetical protein METBIDRAFT_33526 [Metschnikowia bicuspidata var. bicuspidata NRRL YB-4993]|uniref:Uncharacterized protein n=1 Tax=Metschnikowia bicuspidata var. bicuspidata NRRL YB-4993 TaxID=869754 RepID=A0A1A0H605_9ASCO|nr:hypothetical protein METBIDRAFT_33526 [Metschnikowia bicuspidata var. bicuspidata NRRL YB-4993]OBA19348.1 hypothetical protein METBIDRAFT_33526 [Metschnikowia bicuspidata var. bicuspidata NRRL YB-4993]